MTASPSAATAALRQHVERLTATLPADYEVAFDLGAAVGDVLRAAQPDALVPPRYDYMTGPETWHPITRPEVGSLVELCFLPGKDGLCEVWQRTDKGAPVLVGHTPVSALHHLGLTACSVAAEAAREQESEGA